MLLARAAKEHSKEHGKGRSSGNNGSSATEGADYLLNLTDNNGWTALHGAASAGYFAVCELLLGERACRAQIGNKDGNTPLVYAVRHRNPRDPAQYLRVLKLMVEKGADLNTKNKFGEVPLHYACLAGNLEAARFLLKHGADVDSTNRLGETSLHYAVRSTNESLARLLMETGADPNLGTESNQSPLQVAMSKSMENMVKLLSANYDPRPERSMVVDLNPSNMYRDAIKTGNLMKHVRKNKWQRAFFIVKEKHMFHFHSPLDRQPVATFDLSVTTVSETPPGRTDRLYCFDIVSPDCSYLVSAKNEPSRVEWLKTLRQVCERAAKSEPIGGTETATSIWKRGPTRVSTGAGSSSVAQSEIRTQLATLMVQEPENRFCADCSRPTPRWVSCSLGVFICIECAGVHRDLGFLIKSVYLDQWSKRQVQSMRAMGNAKSNNFYESALCATEPRVPHTDSPLSVKAAFIELKYAKKAFTTKNSVFVDPKRYVDAQLLRSRVRSFRADYEHRLRNLLDRLCVTHASLEELRATQLHRALRALLQQPTAQASSVADLLRTAGDNRPGSGSPPANTATLVSSSSSSSSATASARSPSGAPLLGGRVAIAKLICGLCLRLCRQLLVQSTSSTVQGSAVVSTGAGKTAGAQLKLPEAQQGRRRRGSTGGSDSSSTSTGTSSSTASSSSSSSKKTSRRPSDLFGEHPLSPQWSAQVEGALEVYIQQQQQGSDVHTELVMTWWLPQLFEVLAFSTASNLLSAAEGSSSAANSSSSEPDRSTATPCLPMLLDAVLMLRDNTAMALYLLSGEYLFDRQLIHYLSQSPPQQTSNPAALRTRLSELKQKATQLCGTISTLQSSHKTTLNLSGSASKPYTVHQPEVLSSSILLGVLQHRNHVSTALESLLNLVPVHLSKRLLGLEKRGTTFYEVTLKESQLTIDFPREVSRNSDLRLMVANIANAAEFAKQLGKCAKHMADDDSEDRQYRLRQVFIVARMLQRSREDYLPDHPDSLRVWRQLHALCETTMQHLVYLASVNASRRSFGEAVGFLVVHLRHAVTFLVLSASSAS